jgi:hypothetical protein
MTNRIADVLQGGLAATTVLENALELVRETDVSRTSR